MPKKQQRKLTVTVSFDPSRLEEQCLSDAYDLILPMKRLVQRVQRTSERQTGVVSQQLNLFSTAVNQ